MLVSNRESEFSKVLNTGDVLVVAFGAMIGWGWVVSSGQWITSGGVLGTVLGFIIGGIMMLNTRTLARGNQFVFQGGYVPQHPVTPYALLCRFVLC